MFRAPLVDDGIFRLAPGFRAVSIHVDAKGRAPRADGSDPLGEAVAFVRAGGPPWREAHLASWAEVYARFGAKPSRTPCSAQALLKRALKDGVPAINPVVDLYNAVSLRYAVPVGGENDDAYAGAPRLTIADGIESFDTVMNGAPVSDRPDAGEVIWRDDVGVTCRKWNWRQGTRTRLAGDEARMWFVLEALETMPDAALEAAAAALISGLSALMPGCGIERRELAAR